MTLENIASDDDEASTISCLTATTSRLSSSNRFYIDSEEEVLEFCVHVVYVNNGAIFFASSLD